MTFLCVFIVSLVFDVARHLRLVRRSTGHGLSALVWTVGGLHYYFASNKFFLCWCAWEAAIYAWRWWRSRDDDDDDHHDRGDRVRSWIRSKIPAPFLPQLGWGF